MAEHNDLGKEGEDRAVDWLKKQGYSILHRNWRHRHLEIDIIARKDKYLHFVEVKTRYRSRYGHPEDGVTRKKFRKIRQAADEFLYKHPGNPWIRFDIVSVTVIRPGEVEIFLIPDMT